MQVDALLSALNTVKQRLKRNGAYVPKEKCSLSMISMLQVYALAGNPAGFSDYCHHKLASVYGNEMNDLLCELQSELGMPSETTWENFAIIFLK